MLYCLWLNTDTKIVYAVEISFHEHLIPPLIFQRFTSVSTITVSFLFYVGLDLPTRLESRCPVTGGVGWIYASTSPFLDEAFKRSWTRYQILYNIHPRFCLV